MIEFSFFRWTYSFGCDAVQCKTVKKKKKKKKKDQHKKVLLIYLL